MTPGSIRRQDPPPSRLCSSKTCTSRSDRFREKALALRARKRLLLLYPTIQKDKKKTNDNVSTDGGAFNGSDPTSTLVSMNPVTGLFAAPSSSFCFIASASDHASASASASDHASVGFVGVSPSRATHRSTSTVHGDRNERQRVTEDSSDGRTCDLDFYQTAQKYTGSQDGGRERHTCTRTVRPWPTFPGREKQLLKHGSE